MNGSSNNGQLSVSRKVSSGKGFQISGEPKYSLTMLSKAFFPIPFLPATPIKVDSPRPAEQGHSSV